MLEMADTGNNHLKFYHLSEKDLDGQTLVPRIPKNYLTEQGFEENKTARVSFSRSIDGALIGMGQNLEGKELFVHEPCDYSHIQHQLATAKDVPDADFIQEEWVITPVTLKRVGKIIVGEARNEPLIYYIGNRIAETYRWDYEFFDAY